MLEKAIDIAKEAGLILEKYYRGDFSVDTKNGNPFDLLTTADLEADKFIRRRLKEEFPSDGILSEETEDTVEDYSGRVWIVDPLDGTNLFANRESGFCVIIGLCIDGVPSLGVIYDPINDELYYAKRGHGAYLQKGHSTKQLRLRVSNINSLSEARAILTQSDKGGKPYDGIVNQIKVKERLSGFSAGIKIMKIANGDLEFYLDCSYRPSKWDTCGSQIILEEAGGCITDMFNNRLNYKQKETRWQQPFLASNNVIHKLILEEVKRYS